MKSLFFIIAVLFCFVLCVYSQPDTLWTRVIGEVGFTEGAADVQQTSDGGFIVTGGSGSFGAALIDVYLFKIDNSGNQIWSNTFENASMNMSGGYSVKQTSDGGYIILGQSYLFGGSFDAILIKTDAAGNESWFQSYDGGDDELVWEVEQTPDGGYVFVGGQGVSGTNADGWLVKTDANGNVEWEQHYGGVEDDAFYAFDQTSDGGYIMYGFTQSYGLSDSYMWLVKADANGNQEWDQTFGGGSGEWCYDGVQTSDGGYIMVGYTESYSTGGQDAWLVKTDASGNEEWSQNYGGQDDDRGYSVKQTPEGGYIVGGDSPSFSAGDETDFWIVKTDANGVEQWSQTYGGTLEDGLDCVALTSDAGYLLAGQTDSFGDEDGDVYLVCLEGSGSIVEDFGKRLPLEYCLNAPYPNPFNASTAIKYSIPQPGQVSLIIYNIHGQRVATLYNGLQQAGQHTITWDASDVSSGIYFAQLQSHDNVKYTKMVLMK